LDYVFLFTLNQSSILPRNSQKIFGTEHSLNAFGQYDVVCADEELNSVLNGRPKIDFDDNVAALPHSRDYSFLLGQTRRKVDVVSRHPLEAARLNQRPKFGESAMDDCGIERRIGDFGEQLFGIDLLHGVSLSRPDEFVVLPLFDFEALFIVVVDDAVDSFLVDVFAAFPPQKLHDFLEGHISARLQTEALLHGSVPENPRQRLGLGNISISYPMQLSLVYHCK
jgi:hypothetical protein